MLHLLSWLKAHSDISFQIILKDGGVLEPEFHALAPTSVFNKRVLATNKLLTKVAKHSGLQTLTDQIHLSNLKRQLVRDNIGLIYANTVTNGDVLESLSDLECPVICHVHELEHWIRYATGLESFGRVKDHTQHYLGASEAVKKNLILNHGIPEERIDVVHEFIPTLPQSQNSYRNSYLQIREQLAIPKEARIVGASGTYEWRKGPDVFIQLARTVHQRQPGASVYFVWVGGENKGPRFGELMHDVKKVGLEEHIRFIGTQPNPLDYFAAYDVFAMVSREDPFPLVCLEAASVGKPIVCFDVSGGAKEFVENDCGYVVPYLDVETMAARVQDLLSSAELRQQFRRRASEKVRERHDVSIGAAKILQIIKRFL